MMYDMGPIFHAVIPIDFCNASSYFSILSSHMINTVTLELKIVPNIYNISMRNM